MNPSLTTLMTYREIDDEEVIPVDTEELVEGLQVLGIAPVDVRTDGRRLAYGFVQSEMKEPYRKLQMSLAGMAPDASDLDLNQKVVIRTEAGVIELSVADLFLHFFNRYILARTGWKGNLSMSRNIPTAR